ncbi:hypothetical protein ACVIHI_008051 [Bradyrhizobium sp. USDA 4524]|nr:hypothetical protein [Bradyrhizobium sp. USDA 4538]MCP1899598.1 hypothetical protein [Bradyrhizobium sp. USDA 4537]MCP1909882.1 hypothetical protein [Bradyrhizobium elkanii]MCP1986293.1 hypothetical protein [Bradyrhizobium sp. USDA 4539]
MRSEGRPFTLRLLPTELYGNITWLTLTQCQARWLLMRLKPLWSPRGRPTGKPPVHASIGERMHIFVSIRRVPACAQIYIYPTADSNMRQKEWTTVAHASHQRWRPSTHRTIARGQDHLGRYCRCGALDRKRGAALAKQVGPRTQAWTGSTRVIAAAWPPRWRLSNGAHRKPVSRPSRNLARSVRSPRATPLVARSGRTEQAEPPCSRPSAEQN